MSKVIAICNQKGGVGKTTTAIAMSAVLTELGYKVLVVDVDDSGNPSLTKGLGVNLEDLEVSLTDLMLLKMSKVGTGEILKSALEKAILQHQEGFDFIPADNDLPGLTDALNGIRDKVKARNILKTVIDPLRERYDFIILDSAPSLNLVSINTLVATDEVIVTTQAQGASEEGIGELINSALEVKSNLNPGLRVRGLLITMLANNAKSSRETSEKITEKYTDIGLTVFSTKIPRAVAAEKCFDQHVSILKYARTSTVSVAYKAFVKEYLELIGEVR